MLSRKSVSFRRLHRLMNKKTFLLFLAIIVTILVVRSAVAPGGDISAAPLSVTYAPSTEDFKNPERGFMRQSSIYLDNPLDPSKISAVQPSDSLVWIYFRLDNYRDPRDGVGVTVSNYQVKPLEPLGSGKGLDTVQAAFNEARKKGLKLVIRFIYNFGPHSSSDPMKVNPDVPLDAAMFHINQLKPVITNNADVIAAVQLGIVGHFGEWHSSKYLNDLNTRKQIIDAFLQAVPKDRMIMLRYPRYKQLFYGGPLTDANAYNQSDVARIGLYDDAFLRDDNDGGTFRSTVGGVKITNYCDNYPAGEIQCWRDYVSKDSLFVPVGGEAGTQGSTPSTFAQCPNALNQMSTMHFSFLHNGYSKVVLDHWVAQGCMPEIRRRLGYRLVLKNALIPQSVQAGGTLSVDVTLHNEGFASMYNPRPVFMVLQSGSNRYEIPLTAIDPRLWSSGKDHTVVMNGTVPVNVPPGTYKLGLWLPDASAALRNNPAYAVRFANANVWEAATGLNILTASLAVSGSGGTQPPATPTNLPATPTPNTSVTPVQGDMDADGDVDVTDYQLLVPHYGKTGATRAEGDFDSDGHVTLFDFVILVINFGT